MARAIVETPAKRATRLRTRHRPPVGSSNTKGLLSPGAHAAKPGGLLRAGAGASSYSSGIPATLAYPVTSRAAIGPNIATPSEELEREAAGVPGRVALKRLALPLRDGEKVLAIVTPPANEGVDSKAPHSFLPSIRVGDVLPRGLSVAARAAHRGAELFHPKCLSYLPRFRTGDCQQSADR